MKKSITPAQLQASAQHRPLFTPTKPSAPRELYTTSRDGIIACSKADAQALDRDHNLYS